MVKKQTLSGRRARAGLVITLGITCQFAITGRLLAFHDDYLHERDSQPPWMGSGVVNGGAPPMLFPASGVELLSWLPLPEFGGQITSGSTVEGYVSPSGTEYALLGISHGVAFIRLDDPGDPQILTVEGANKFITGPTSLWHDIRVYQNHAYAVSEGGSGIQVIDMSQIDSGVVTLVNTITSGGGTTATHTVFINQDSGFLYRCGGGGAPYQGIRIYSLADPANPVPVATWNNRYVHETQVVSYTSGIYAGKEVAFLYSEDTSGGGNAGIDILDVTNKASIQSLSFLTYPNATFSHQGWLSPDRRYLYQDDELDENQFGITSLTRIFDVQDLENPFFAGSFSSGAPSIDHNLYTKDNLIFESNYRSGLRVFDTTDPLAPTEIAYFDTYPSDDNASFNSLWDNYPYLPSGIVLGSDIEKGLFVWWVGAPLLTFDYPDGRPDLINPAGEALTLHIAESATDVLQSKTVRFHYDTGSGFVEVPLSGNKANLFQALIPAGGCGSSISYYFSAKSTNGITWRDPQSAPNDVYTAYYANSQTVAASYAMEAADGWTSGAPGDNAVTGLWVRVDPIGSGAQPEDDHTPAGTICWVTGQGTVGGGLGEADVDGGRTTLTTPTLDLTGIDLPSIGYWRWYSNNTGGAPGADVFTVDISNNNGSSWINAETVGPTGTGTLGGWYYHEFSVADFVAPTSQVKVRFVADDAGAGSVIEAAIDDFQVHSFTCLIDCNGNLIGDAEDISTGFSRDCNGNDIPDECDGFIPPPYGDVVPAGGNGLIDVDDIIRILNGFVNPLLFPNADIHPCAGGDGDIDTDDIQAILDTFVGNPPCMDSCS